MKTKLMKLKKLVQTIDGLFTAIELHTEGHRPLFVPESRIMIWTRRQKATAASIKAPRQRRVINKIH